MAEVDDPKIMVRQLCQEVAKITNAHSMTNDQAKDFLTKSYENIDTAIDAYAESNVKNARFDELTEMGKRLNRSRKELIDHYEERYKLLGED